MAFTIWGAIAPSWAQSEIPNPHLVQAEMVLASTENPAQTTVEIHYTVAEVATLYDLPIRAVAFFDTDFLNLTAHLDSLELALAVDRTAWPRMIGSIALPIPDQPTDTLTLTLRYQVNFPPPSDQFDVRVPVVFVDLPPMATPEDLFTVRAEMPAHFSVTESFPTVPKQRELTGDTAQYTFGLQVVPALVRFRGYLGAAPWLTPTRAVDLGVLLLLVLGAGFGWYRLRQATGTKPPRYG